MCLVGTSPDKHVKMAVRFKTCHCKNLTIISSSFPTLIPFRLTTCKYFNPLRTSCCTLNVAFMRNLAPSLMVKGFDFRDSTAPGALRSIVMSERPSTSRARERMMQRRVSDGSTGRGGELLIPREAFHRFRDSSFWSRRR